MSLLGDIRNLKLNSRSLRAALRCIYREGSVYKIRWGPLRGVRLRYHPSINFHAMLGAWELENLRFLSRVFAAAIKSSDTVYDVGANIGLYSLWVASKVPSGCVLAFKASSSTAATLRDQLSLNNGSNIQVIEAAVAAEDGAIQFYQGFHHHSSSLNQEWAEGGKSEVEPITVRAIRLDSVPTLTDTPPPQFIKMDIEGGAVWALKGCNQIAQSARPLIFIESHTPEEDSAISEFLLLHEYEAYRINNNQWVARRDQPHPCADGVWGTMLLVPSGERNRLISAGCFA